MRANPGRQAELHQIDRKTHNRAHHQNVDEAHDAGHSALRWAERHGKHLGTQLLLDPAEQHAAIAGSG
jgi:hypothetical protein